MAHELKQMAYIGATPWHGLGNDLLPGTAFDDWFEPSGLNFRVLSSPVSFIVDGQLTVFPKTKALYRSDDHFPLSVVSDRYNVVQPREVLEFYRDLVRDFDFTLETAGVLMDGKRIWALAKTNESHKILGIDEIKNYLLLATSYDGTFATTAQFTSVRVVCNNTLQLSLNKAQPAVKVPHMTSFDAKAVKTELGLTAGAWEAFKKTTDILARIAVDSKQADTVIKAAFRAVEVPVNATDRASAGHVERVSTMFNTKGFIGADLATADGTAWGVVNCVTEYLDHIKRSHTQASRLNNSWFGNGAVIKSRAVEAALAL